MSFPTAPASSNRRTPVNPAPGVPRPRRQAESDSDEAYENAAPMNDHLTGVRMEDTGDFGEANAAASAPAPVAAPPAGSDESVSASALFAMMREMMQAQSETVRRLTESQMAVQANGGNAAPPQAIRIEAQRKVPVIKYTDLPMLTLTCPEQVDQWFVDFEQRLKAHQVEPRQQVACFATCDKVPVPIKTKYSGVDSYEEIRRAILAEHGPVDPVGYFLAKVHLVRGQNRTDVLDELEKYMILHNRAAVDKGVPVLTRDNLVTPFLIAFPDEIKAELSRHHRAAANSGDALTYLLDYAPEKRSENTALLAQMKVEPSTPAVESEMAALMPMVAQEVAKALSNAGVMNGQLRDSYSRVGYQSRFQKGRLPDGRCTRCGTKCLPGACRAQGQDCRKCGGKGHFARVCRNGAGEQPARGFAQSQPVTRPNPKKNSFRKGKAKVAQE